MAFAREETNSKHSHPGPSADSTAKVFSTFADASCKSLSPAQPPSLPQSPGSPQGQPAPAPMAVGMQDASLDTQS